MATRRWCGVLALGLAGLLAWAEDPATRPAVGQRFAVVHAMEYEYDRPVTLGPHVLRLFPQAWAAGTVTASELTVTFPGKHALRKQLDLDGNLVAAVEFDGPTKAVAFRNRVVVAVPAPPPEPRPAFYAAAFPFAYTADEAKRLAPFLEVPSDPGPKLAQYSAGVARDHVSSVGWLGDLTRKLHKEVKCFTRDGEGVLSPEETLTTGGSCRDLAWVQIQLLRRKGVAARFVSGYQIPPWALGPEKKAHPAELHAWVEAYLPGAGWVGLDPTAGKATDGTYVPLAATAVPRDAGPVEGTFLVSPPTPNALAKSTLKYRVTVEPLGP